jgi:probable phosphoglycerate mutase
MTSPQMADRRIPALQRWPSKVWLVRHGESAGNVARDAAHAASLPDINLETRDIDVPLSARGEQQSEALGRWFGALAPDARPEVVFSSPYLRARRTAVNQHRSGTPGYVKANLLI